MGSGLGDPTALTSLRFSRQMSKPLARFGTSFLRGTRSSPKGVARRRSRESSYTHNLVATQVTPGHTSPAPCLPTGGLIWVLTSGSSVQHPGE